MQAEQNERGVVADFNVGPDLDHGWRDVREAKPRCRVRVTDDQDGHVTVYDDGAIDHSANIEVDWYEGDEYADIRNEVVQIGGQNAQDQ